MSLSSAIVTSCVTIAGLWVWEVEMFLCRVSRLTHHFRFLAWSCCCCSESREASWGDLGNLQWCPTNQLLVDTGLRFKVRSRKHWRNDTVSYNWLWSIRGFLRRSWHLGLGIGTFGWPSQPVINATPPEMWEGKWMKNEWKKSLSWKRWPWGWNAPWVGGQWTMLMHIFTH